MAKKKGKGGKKGKAAQPKKIPVQAYDLDDISKEELMKYIAGLEKELALMTKDCAFYNTNKIKIMEFLNARRNEFMSEKRMSVVNNTVTDEAIEKLKQFPVKLNERKIFKDREKVRMKFENLFEDFVANSSSKAGHLDREHVLKQQIADKNKRIESDSFFCRTTLMDMKESYQGVLENMDVMYGKKLEDILMENVNKCLKANQGFNAEKIRSLISTWDVGDRRCPWKMKESYISEMKRMQDFFHEISSNNAVVIKILRKKLSDLVIENQKTNFNLKKVLQQNVELREFQPTALPYPRKGKTSLKVLRGKGNVPDEKVVKLQYQNEALNIHLRSVKADLRNLQKQFIAAMRKIQQKAEFKAFMTEEMIRVALQIDTFKAKQEDSQEYEEQIKEHKDGKKSKSVNDIVNNFILSVERSDTLFVPPVYHDFWDPSIKYSQNYLKQH